MKRKIRKMIVAGITACAIMVPTIASAYSSYPLADWDWKGGTSASGYVYGWASYDHHVCHVKLHSSPYETEWVAGWCEADSPYLKDLGAPWVEGTYD